MKSRDSSVRVTTGCGLDARGSIPFRGKIFLFSIKLISSLGSTKPPIQSVGTGTLSSGVKRPGQETDHSPPCNVEVKIGGVIPPLVQMSSWHGV
jgi:hypothetical protein